MKNSIVVKIPFNFKGETHEPKSRIDLNDWVKREAGVSLDWVTQVAVENGIGSYSYELEVMESSELKFESPTGMAIQFYDTEAQTFDFDGFKSHWHQVQALEVLQRIHQQVFAEPLQTESNVYKVMMQAYEAGKASV